MSEDIGTKFVKRVYGRLHYQNKNWLAIICGETGSGKSYSALSLAQKIGKVHLVFTPIQFLKLLNSDKLEKGNVIVFDEAGVGMSSREWYSVQNKLLGSVLQTFRNLNCGVIFTTPNLSFIDVQARKLFHNYFETSYLDLDNEEAHLKVYDIQVNSRLDKLYYKYPKFLDNNKHTKLTHLILNKPSDSIIDYYEIRKSDFTKKLNQKALEGLIGPTEPNEKEQKIDEKNILKDIIKRKKQFVREYNKHKYIDKDLIRAEYDLSYSLTNKLKKQAEEKILMPHTQKGKA